MAILLAKEQNLFSSNDIRANTFGTDSEWESTCKCFSSIRGKNISWENPSVRLSPHINIGEEHLLNQSTSKNRTTAK